MAMGVELFCLSDTLQPRNLKPYVIQLVISLEGANEYCSRSDNHRYHYNIPRRKY